ncbi:MAG: hypothetical protein DRN68_01525 [Thaumarchaeota archaeon]|nr:MAG: hypothetical protein DRN68_01525 [Nitrososphaerota archaeon]
MKTGRLIMAILFAALLLSSMIAATASPQDRHKMSSTFSQTSYFNHSQPDIDKILKDQLKNKAKRAIDEASEIIAEAKELLEEAKESGLPTSMMEELLNSAEQFLEKAKQSLNDAPEKALSLAMHAKSLAKIVINGVKKLLSQATQIHVNKTSTESRCKKFREILENLTRRALTLRSRLSNLTIMNLNMSEIQSTLSQAFELINETLSSINAGEIPANIEKILKEIQRILDEVEDEIESMIETMTSTTFKPSMTHTHIGGANKTINRSKIHTTKTMISRNATETRKIPRLNMTKIHEKNETSFKQLTKVKEINITVAAGREKMIQIEHYMTLKSGAGGVSMVKEILITVGNKTIIKINKELTAGNKSVTNEIVVEKNQTIIGALIKVGKKNSSQVRLDLNLSVTTLDVERNRLKLRVGAPNGTSGRIIVIQLEPDVIDLNKIKKFKVLVNGKEAILASSILDLASEVYREPAYVFVISSKGASILLYIPHFSDYTIEILGVIEAIKSILTDALSKTLTRDLLITSTVAATIIAFVIAIGQARRKERIQRI